MPLQASSSAFHELRATSNAVSTIATVVLVAVDESTDMSLIIDTRLEESSLKSGVFIQLSNNKMARRAKP